MNKIKLKLALYLEKRARKLKKELQEEKRRDFLLKYDLMDVPSTQKINVHYNPYEGTNLCLLDKLIESNYISPRDHIVDIGCGTGIVLLYLVAHGFNKLSGIEMDENLYALASSNLKSYKNKTNVQLPFFKLYNENAIDIEYPDDINVFYIFNTFYDKETYLQWIHKVEYSLFRNPREITIIILYPTVASMGAMREVDWLEETDRVISKEQVCHYCMHYIIYKGGFHN